MARIARLLCVLCVLSLSASAFATPIPMDVDITNSEPDNSFAAATVLTAGRVDTQRVDCVDDGTLTLTSGDEDYFRVDLKTGDELMVITQALASGGVPIVTLYDSNEDLLTLGGGTMNGPFGGAGWIDPISADKSFYVRITGSGAIPYKMMLSISNHTPEPATMSLLALGGIAMLKRRRKR